MPSSKPGPGWQALPHYWSAYNESTTIVSALWKHPIYGHSRERNQHGARTRHRRYMDRFGFKDINEAIAVVTKIILRDRYGEWPPTMRPDELTGIGRAKRKGTCDGRVEVQTASAN